MTSGYTATYRPETLFSEPGWAYSCFHNGREIFNGWSRGSKREAESEVRRGIANREALHGAANAQGAN